MKKIAFAALMLVASSAQAVQTPVSVPGREAACRQVAQKLKAEQSVYLADVARNEWGCFVTATFYADQSFETYLNKRFEAQLPLTYEDVGQHTVQIKFRPIIPIPFPTQNTKPTASECERTRRELAGQQGVWYANVVRTQWGCTVEVGLTGPDAMLAIVSSRIAAAKNALAEFVERPGSIDYGTVYIEYSTPKPI